MTNKEIFNLNLGDKLKYASQNWELKDWNCFKEPLFDRLGNRIDAEPIISNGKNRISLSFLYWNEVEKI